MKKHVVFYSILLLIIFVLSLSVYHLSEYEPTLVKMNFDTDGHDFIPEEGFVPDKETAIAIAEAVWLPIYGGDIYTKKPYVVGYDKNEDCWLVAGQLQPDYFGGVPEIKIRKTTGEILYVSHGR